MTAAGSPHIDPADRVEFVARRVGPGHPQAAPGERISGLAADNHFASALITLWHRVSQAGGAAGFEPASARFEIAPAATEAVAGLRAGRWNAVVLTDGNALVGAAFLIRRPLRIQSHIADVRGPLVDPDHRGIGLGSRLMDEIAALATELDVTLLTTTVRDGQLHDASPADLGFVEFGRLPGALLVSAAFPGSGGGAAGPSAGVHAADEVYFQRRLG